MRPDKVTLAALAATLGLYRAGRADDRDPRLADDRRLARGLGQRADGDRCRTAGGRADARHRSTELTSTVGGGSLPGETLASVGLAIAGPRADRLARAAARRRAGGRRADRATARCSSTCGRSSPADDAALDRRAGARALGAVRAMTVVIGTAGHIDHGKTTLLRALTGIDADRLPEERRRGMTIDVGYAHLALPDGTELDFVDVPGHDRLVGNMLVGAGEIDAAMLVVAADDGPRAQTLEHLALLDALGIRHGLAVVTKTDLAGPERTAEVVAAVERLLEGTSLAWPRCWRRRRSTGAASTRSGRR